MATTATLTAPFCCFFSSKRINPIQVSLPKTTFFLSKSNFASFTTLSSSNYRFGSDNLTLIKRPNGLVCNSLSTVFSSTNKYEFSDGPSEVEVRLELGDESTLSSKDVFVDADENSMLVRIKHAGSLRTAMEIDRLYDRIKPAETIWLLDDDQLVIILKKQDQDVKWPDIMESWDSLSVGVLQLLKGTSIYLVGDSTEINQKVSRELAVGLGYTQLDTKDLLETFTKQTIDSCEYFSDRLFFYLLNLNSIQTCQCLLRMILRFGEIFLLSGIGQELLGALPGSLLRLAFVITFGVAMVRLPSCHGYLISKGTETPFLVGIPYMPQLPSLLCLFDTHLCCVASLHLKQIWPHQLLHIFSSIVIAK